MTAASMHRVPMAAPSANDRLKARFRASFWQSLLAAALIHLAVLALGPTMSVAGISAAGPERLALDIVPPVDVPPPPEPIQRPAVPVLSTEISLSDDLTIPPTRFENHPVGELPLPPTRAGVSSGEEPTFTPYEVKPELRNRAEFARLLERHYPPTLRDAGIGGTVVLWVLIDASGSVQNTRVTRSSGYEPLDRVAEEVMRQARFSPALNRDQRVPVWIQLPVTFQTR